MKPQIWQPIIAISNNLGIRSSYLVSASALSHKEQQRLRLNNQVSLMPEPPSQCCNQYGSTFWLFGREERSEVGLSLALSKVSTKWPRVRSRCKLHDGKVAACAIYKQHRHVLCAAESPIVKPIHNPLFDPNQKLKSAPGWKELSTKLTTNNLKTWWPGIFHPKTTLHNLKSPKSAPLHHLLSAGTPGYQTIKKNHPAAPWSAKTTSPIRKAVLYQKDCRCTAFSCE